MYWLYSYPMRLCECLPRSTRSPVSLRALPLPPVRPSFPVPSRSFPPPPGLPRSQFRLSVRWALPAHTDIPAFFNTHRASTITLSHGPGWLQTLMLIEACFSHHLFPFFFFSPRVPSHWRPRYLCCTGPLPDCALSLSFSASRRASQRAEVLQRRWMIFSPQRASPPL